MTHWAPVCAINFGFPSFSTFTSSTILYLQQATGFKEVRTKQELEHYSVLIANIDSIGYHALSKRLQYF